MKQEETRIGILEDVYFELESRRIESINKSEFLEVLVSMIIADDNKMERVKYDSNESKAKFISLVFKCLKFIMSPDLYNPKDVMGIYYLTNRLIVYAGENYITQPATNDLKVMFSGFMENYASFIKDKEDQMQYLAVLYGLRERKEGSLAGAPVFRDEKYTLNILSKTIEKVESYYEKNNKKEGCYIATYIYGSYEAEEVIILRDFRDSVLKKFQFGNLFIKIYYFISPKLINIFSESLIFKMLCKHITSALIDYSKSQQLKKK
jgi:hypothetical protein